MSDEMTPELLKMLTEGERKQLAAAGHLWARYCAGDASGMHVCDDVLIEAFRKLAEARLAAQQVRDGLEPVIAHRECVGTGCIMCGDRGTVSWMLALTDAENQARRGEAKLDALQAELTEAQELIVKLNDDWHSVCDERDALQATLDVVKRMMVERDDMRDRWHNATGDWVNFPDELEADDEPAIPEG